MTLQSVTEPSGVLEVHTIAPIPLDQRHGRTRDLFTVWFGSNLGLLTAATGAFATHVFHVPLIPALLALALGNVVGGLVMALHAAQGPQMGVPQMLQTRAQFGSYGSLTVTILVVLMYVGFFASNTVLSGTSLNLLTGLNNRVCIVLSSLIAFVVVVLGYRTIHLLGLFFSIVAGLALLAAFICVFQQGIPADALTVGQWSWAGFLAALSVAALWQIAYAPYVSDYTRYLPPHTGVRSAFWGTYIGSVLGSLFPMALGALLGAVFPDLDTINSMMSLGGSAAFIIVGILALAMTVTNGMNLYCCALSVMTVAQTFLPSWRPQAASRAVISWGLLMISLLLSLLAADNFLGYYTNFLVLLLCVLIPWTAINLVDYYLVAHGEYDIDALFLRDGGIYGKFNSRALVCYLIGILVQIPFLTSEFYQGPIAVLLDDADISWLIGLAVTCPLYYWWTQKNPSVPSHTTPAVLETV